MNLLLIFFAIPLAVVILSVILEKAIKSPITVAAITFAILVVVTFAAFDINFLVLAIIYTILSYITAAITEFVCRVLYADNRHRESGHRYDFVSNTNTVNDEEVSNQEVVANAVPNIETIIEPEPIENDNITQVRARRRRRRENR